MCRVHKGSLLNRDLISDFQVMNRCFLVIIDSKCFFIILLFFPLAITFDLLISELLIISLSRFLGILESSLPVSLNILRVLVVQHALSILTKIEINLGGSLKSISK